jgi:hypothetical protein
MTDKVEITNGEPIFLHYTLNLAFDGLNHDSGIFITDINKLALRMPLAILFW